jgi:hypothetical protein
MPQDLGPSTPASLLFGPTLSTIDQSMIQDGCG